MRHHTWFATALLCTALLGGGLVQPAGAVVAKNISISSTCAGGAFFCFVPASAPVVTGRQVIWKNNTSAPHQLRRCTAAACSGASGGTGTDTGFGSAVISGSGMYSFTFHGLGTYVYYCAIHGYAVMHGTITVDPAPTISSLSPPTLPRGSANKTVHVTGTGFRAGIKAKLSGTGVTVSSTVRVDAAHLTLTVSVASSAATGMRSLTVTNTDGGTKTKPGALNVT